MATTNDTIEDLVRADHEKSNEKYNTLEQMAAQFQRGDKIYCARVESTQTTIRFGIINNILYKNSEMIFNVSQAENTAPFTISSRNWDIFELEQDLYDFLHEKIGEADDANAETATNDGGN